MSKFFTSIPVAVDELKKLLPEGAAVERVIWNARETRVELHWSLDKFYTGRDYPFEFSAEGLRDGKLPKGVTLGRPKPVAPAAAPELPEGSQIPETENEPQRHRDTEKAKTAARAAKPKPPAAARRRR